MAEAIIGMVIAALIMVFGLKARKAGERGAILEGMRKHAGRWRKLKEAERESAEKVSDAVDDVVSETIEEADDGPGDSTLEKWPSWDDEV